MHILLLLDTERSAGSHWASVRIAVLTFPKNTFSMLTAGMLMKGFYVATVIRDMNCLFRKYRLFSGLEAIEKNLHECVNTKKDYKMFTIRIRHVVIMSK
jgi:hypothetical protein